MITGQREGGQNVHGNTEFRWVGNLIRKMNRMMEIIEILKKFKSVEYSPNYIDPESEKNLYLGLSGCGVIIYQTWISGQESGIYGALNSGPF